MVDWIDSLVESGLFSSRSEALREFTREMVDGKKWLQKYILMKLIMKKT